MPKKGSEVALILAQLGGGKGRPPGDSEHEEEEYGEGMEKDDELLAIASELIAAVKQGDTKATVEALRAAFLCLDAEPHTEGEHLNEEEEEGEGEETVSHETGERLGGYSRGGKVKRYSDGGDVFNAIYGTSMREPKKSDEYGGGTPYARDVLRSMRG